MTTALAYDDVPTRELAPDEIPESPVRMLSRVVIQEDAELIDPLPPSPFPPLKELTWLSRLGQPPWRPRVPWAFVAAFGFTLAGLAVGFATR